MSIIVYTTSKKAIQLAKDPISTPGGEGSVHNILNDSKYMHCCVKIYHPHKRTALKKQKIEHMIQNKPSGLVTANYLICWPNEIVFDVDGRFAGHIMPLAFPDSESLYQFTRHNITSQNNSINDDKFDRSVQGGMEKRLKICVNISAAVHSIHSIGHYTIVDYKPQNVLITNNGTVSIIDTDSFQVSENENLLFPSEVATPEYAPPESEKINLSKDYVPQSWDSFSLAVSFYEILFSVHPYAATAKGQYQEANTIGDLIRNGLFVHGAKSNYLRVIPELHKDFYNLPQSLQKLFYNAFEIGNANPKARPTAEQWGSAIFNELKTGTRIKPNANSIGKNKNKNRSAQPPATQSDSGTTNATSKKINNINKKDKDMAWRISTAILGLVIVIMFAYQQTKEKHLENAKNDILELTTEKDSLQNQQNQNRTEINSLNERLSEIGSRYPITITNIAFVSVDDNNNESSKGQSFYIDEGGYVSPVITYNSNLKDAGEYNVSYRYFSPDGTLITSNLSQNGYTLTNKLIINGAFEKDNERRLGGLKKFVYWMPGIYRTEVWCNGVMVGSGSFTMLYR